MMKFMVVRASSPYNIILGRTGLQELRAISSTIHAMMKFSTPKGIATLCARGEPVYECRWPERKMVKQEEAPSDIVGVPRRLIRHSMNVNNSVPSVAQKQRVLRTEKSKV
nr:hypothetical protein [Tanacetum cinerariifolium]